MTVATTHTHDPVDRLAEDFLTRYRQGERPSISDYAKQFPDVADQVADVIQVLLLMENLGAEQADQQDQELAAVPERLGEYAIVRELGRGGMGVVYEAVQEDLGRHVALKVLPAAALLRSTQLERFRREARAAARLHHSNIVPVFGVGVQDGIYFYAMQYIQGQSLDHVLKEVRREREASGSRDTIRDAAASTHSSTISGYSSRHDYARAVAQIGLQVAQALAHAHAQGVLHRDVKPSNVLLDQEGRAWLSDFGLAQLDASDQLTGTGEIVGTLRFMAPERFKRQGDARSDVYSLGLTIYELLTLQPAFQESDRAKLIHQILKEEPVSPRQIDPGLPRDLETIVLKAMTKEPEHRYQTAQALADDLQRFLVDRPVTARRLRWWERSWRWVQRNGALSITAGLAFAALIVGLAMTYWQWQRAESESTEKENKRKEAEGHAESARQQRDRADEYAKRSRQILDGLLNELARLPQRVTTDEIRQRLFDSALRVHQDYINNSVNLAIPLLETARLCTRAAHLHRQLGEFQKAQEYHHEVEALLAAGLADQRQEPQVILIAAENSMGKGLLLKSMQKHQDALICLCQSIKDYQSLVKVDGNNPDYVFGLTYAKHNLVSVLPELLQMEECITHLSESIELEEQFMARLGGQPLQAHREIELARKYVSLTTTYLMNQQLEKANATNQKELEKLNSVVKRWPRSIPAQDLLGQAYNNRIITYQRLARRAEGIDDNQARLFLKEAESSGRQAIKIYESLIKQAPASPEYKSRYGAAASNLASQLVANPKEAENLIKKAIDHQREAIRLSPSEPGLREYLMNHFNVQSQIFLHGKDHVKAAQSAAQLRTVADPKLHIDYLAARILAQCLDLAQQDAALVPERRQKIVQEYQTKTLDALRAAIKRDTHPPTNHLDKTAKDFMSLTKSTEFQQLMDDLRKKSRNSR